MTAGGYITSILSWGVRHAFGDRHQKGELVHLYRRYNVSRPEVFGSAAGDTEFDPETSEADFPVEFDRQTAPTILEQYSDLRDALRGVLVRRIGLAEQREFRNPYVLV